MMKLTISAATVIVLASVLLALAGCGTPATTYLYQPKPAVAAVRAADDDRLLAQTLASIVGVRYPESDAGPPPAMEVRLRVENFAAGEVRFDPNSLALLTGNLREFGAPRLQPSEEIELASGEASVVDALFPFPAPPEEGSLDLSTLQARWTLDVDGRQVIQSASFDRQQPTYRRSYYYYDRYPPHYYYHHGHGFFYPYRYAPRWYWW